MLTSLYQQRKEELMIHVKTKMDKSLDTKMEDMIFLVVSEIEKGCRKTKELFKKVTISKQRIRDILGMMEGLGILEFITEDDRFRWTNELQPRISATKNQHARDIAIMYNKMKQMKTFKRNYLYYQLSEENKEFFNDCFSTLRFFNIIKKVNPLSGDLEFEFNVKERFFNLRDIESLFYTVYVIDTSMNSKDKE